MAGRKILTPLLISALLVMVATASAQTTLPAQDEYEATLDVRTSVWDTSPGGTGDPVAVGDPLQAGDEQRASVSLNGMDFADLTIGDPNNTIKTLSTGSVPGYSGSDLRGLLYDVNYRTADTGTPQGTVTYWEAGTRYVAGTDWTDTYTEGSAVGAVDGLAGYGAIAVLYDHEGWTQSWTGAGAGGGDDDWSEKTGPGSTDGSIAVTDEYPSVNTGAAASATDPTNPWLVIALAPLPSAVTSDTAGYPSVSSTDVLIEENFQFADSNNTGSANGYAWGNVIGGTFAERIAPDIFGTGLDVRFDFSATFATSSANAQGWLADAEDPFGFATPEPTTASLLIVGLLGLLSIRRKRN